LSQAVRAVVSPEGSLGVEGMDLLPKSSMWSLAVLGFLSHGSLQYHSLFCAAITEYYRLGIYNELKFIGLQFWRLGSPGLRGQHLVRVKGKQKMGECGGHELILLYIPHSYDNEPIPMTMAYFRQFDLPSWPIHLSLGLTSHHC
jgi:hypothetical protein